MSNPNDPGQGGLDAHLDALNAAIRDQGYAVQAIMASAYEPPFAYTIGLTETFDHPELVVVGLNQAGAQELLRLAVERLRASQEATGRLTPERLEGERIVEDFSQGLTVATCDLPHEAAAEVLSFAAARYPRGFAATQIFLPDGEGRFPWDPEADSNWRQVQTGLFGLGRSMPAGLKH